MISGRILLSTVSDFAGVVFLCPPPPSLCSIALPPHPSLAELSALLSSFCLLSSMAVASDTQFHVLAVDDSIIDRKLIEKLLRTSSYLVTAVDSGNKALEFLGLQEEHGKEGFPSVSSDHHDVDVNLIITDYCMPGMTGYDLLKKIKESSLFKDIPVVIMSSENVPSRITRCLEKGADEFILKPVQLADVKRLKPCLSKSKNKEQQDQQEQQHQSNNKRKATEEILLQESRRKRPDGVSPIITH